MNHEYNAGLGLPRDVKKYQGQVVSDVGLWKLSYNFYAS